MTDTRTKESDAAFVTSAMVDRACEAFDPIGLFRPKAELAVRMKEALAAALTKPAAPIHTEKGEREDAAKFIDELWEYVEPHRSEDYANVKALSLRRDGAKRVLREALARRAQPAADLDAGRVDHSAIIALCSRVVDHVSDSLLFADWRPSRAYVEHMRNMLRQTINALSETQSGSSR